ncbi:MAG: hypothetical protein JWN71_1756 [Xanthobacteraceae bacterium]|jgi:hypothetical protein|nr:hypothetical protein [Xanthobacteraceae bacterium]
MTTNTMLFMVLGGGLGIAFALLLRRFFPVLRGKRREVVAPSGPANRQAMRHQARRQHKVEQARKSRHRG